MSEKVIGTNVKTVLKEYEAKSKGRKLKFGVGVDGSDIAEKAFQIMTRFAKQKDRGDRLYCLHVAPFRGKVANPLNKAEAIESEIQRHAFSAHVEVSFFAREKKETDKTADVLVALAEELDLDLLLVGTYGRKGPEPHVGGRLGSVADSTLRYTHLSVGIIKSSSFSLVKNMTFLVCTDNSRASQLAFSRLVTDIAKPGDSIIVLLIHTDLGADALLKPYDEAIKEHQFDGKTIFMHDPALKNVAAVIDSKATELGADAIVLGIANYTTHKLGSVSEEVIKNSKVSVLCFKDSMRAAEAKMVQGTLSA